MATYWQQITRADLRHTPPGTGLASSGPLAGAAKAGRGKEPIAPPLITGRDTAGCMAARAVDVQFKLVPADVAYGLEWKRAENGAKLTPRLTDAGRRLAAP
jgi:hypothetical protein